METIIGLLFILLPLIFKLIGKKFEQAGQSERAEKMREIAQTLRGGDDDDEDDPFKDWLGGRTGRETVVECDDDGQVTEVRPAAPAPVAPTPVVVRPVQSVQQTVTENVTRQTTSRPKPTVKAKRPMLEEETKKKGEKIDPKKLVIYSEIMKPKFTE